MVIIHYGCGAILIFLLHKCSSQKMDATCFLFFKVILQSMPFISLVHKLASHYIPPSYKNVNTSWTLQPKKSNLKK